jgi:hypothetical protein
MISFTFNHSVIYAQAMAQSNADRHVQENRCGGEDELRMERFSKNNPPVFKGKYDPDKYIYYTNSKIIIQERILSIGRTN